VEGNRKKKRTKSYGIKIMLALVGVFWYNHKSVTYAVNIDD